MSIQAVNPANGEVLQRYSEITDQHVGHVVARVARASAEWKKVPVATRAELLMGASKVLTESSDQYARLMALEMGKPLGEGIAEVRKCAWVCEYYAENARHFLEDEHIRTDANKSYVRYEPLGTILAIMPWNFPFWQVFRCAAPALAAGNTVVLKHASNVPGCALAIERVFREASFPRGVLRVLLMGSDRVGSVMGMDEISAVTFTGSTPAGRAVASQAGGYLKKTVLELGGSDPYLVLADADLELAASSCVKGRMLNGGQSCIAAKRLVVVESVRQAFEELLVEKMRDHIMGDPLSRGVTLGPLARFDLRDELHRQVEQSIESGARLLLGGAIPEGPGAFYPPTVLTGVSRGMPAYHEELFGPVACVIPVADEEHAIATANDSSFGLGAAVFSRDGERAEQIAAHHLRAGSCFVNDFVRSDPRLPFGGVKGSGYGRELGRIGIQEFVNVKTIFVGRA